MSKTPYPAGEGPDCQRVWRLWVHDVAQKGLEVGTLSEHAESASARHALTHATHGNDAISTRAKERIVEIAYEESAERRMESHVLAALLGKRSDYLPLRLHTIVDRL